MADLSVSEEYKTAYTKATISMHGKGDPTERTPWTLDMTQGHVSPA